MARIVLGSYMVRYPLGGMMSWVLQYIVGFQRLGHDIFFVEKGAYPQACYDPEQDVMTDDCTYGTRAVNELLARFGLEGSWCFVDVDGVHHGMQRPDVEEALRTADVFVDMGTHGAWMEEASGAGLRVLIDGEPGFTQMKMAKREAAGETLPRYDRYYTTGRSIGTDRANAPTAGREWGTLFHPVVTDLFEPSPPPPDAAYTTVMNWQSYPPLEYGGSVFGHKDVEFAKFMELPRMVTPPLEIAVSGEEVPQTELVTAGWRVRDAHEVTQSFDSFRSYLAGSRGEFSVCKNGYVATGSGWFSDRGAAYLASGRPVIQQETGFSRHLPCGEGLFAVTNAEDAAAAIEEIEGDYGRHSRAAREIACERLEAKTVLRAFLAELGL